MCAELQALEQEQRQIDGRAAEVETQLRSLMESGGVSFWSPLPDTCCQICPPCSSSRPWAEWRGGRLGSSSPFTAGHTEALSQEAACLEAHSSDFWDATKEQTPSPTSSRPAPDTSQWQVW